MGKKRGKKGKNSEKPLAKTKKATQVLAAKDQVVFKQLVTLYEKKEYKKGIKAADLILKANADHGETLAMKGLILNCMKHKDEARAHVKLGLSKNFTSYVCWHVYGLIHRSDYNYDEAIKCYKHALKFDKENAQILKDISLLQIQRRKYDEFQETRRQVLVSKAANKSNWLAYAVGLHLCKNYPKALTVCNEYKKFQETKDVFTYEESELELYMNMIIEESGNVQRALTHLDEIERVVIDKTHWLQKKAELLIKVGRSSEAEPLYRQLLDMNPDNHAYFKGLLASLSLSPDADGSFGGATAKAVLAVYDSLKEKYPRSGAVMRLPLEIVTGDELRERVAPILKKGMRKGIPSLFRDVCALYTDSAKAEIIHSMLLEYAENLKSDCRFTKEDQENSESPACYLWCLLTLAQHYNHFGDSKKALEYIDLGMAHTSTAIDFYVHKARIYKHGGDPLTAFYWMNKARTMDLADRYLNVKCVRYAFRADRVNQAEEIVTLFLRDGDSIISLFEMQASWYELQCGHSYARQKNWARCLKEYYNIDKHFKTINEDQSDFHTYCLRKMTLRAYVRMLRWEDTLKSHRFWNRAAKGIVRAYLCILDENDAATPVAQTSGNQEVEGSTESKGADKEDTQETSKKLTAAQKRALRKKRKKEQAAAAANAAQQGNIRAEKDEEEKANKSRKSVEAEQDDDDPKGEKLLKADPYTQCTEVLKDLNLYCPEDLEARHLAIQIYTQKNKLIVALRYLIQAIKLGGKDHHVTHLQLLAFFHHTDQLKDSPVGTYIETERKSLVQGSLASMNDALLKAHSNSLAHRLSAAYGTLLLSPTAKGKGPYWKNKLQRFAAIDSTEARTAKKAALGIVLNYDFHEVGLTLSTAQEAYEFVKTLGDEEEASAFRFKANARFPLALAFLLEDEKPNLDQMLAADEDEASSVALKK